MNAEKHLTPTNAATDATMFFYKGLSKMLHSAVCICSAPAEVIHFAALSFLQQRAGSVDTVAP
jgi:hypothetical protein